MAKIIEEVIIIKLSKLVKDNDNSNIVSDELESSLEQVAQELVGEAVIVEMEKAYWLNLPLLSYYRKLPTMGAALPTSTPLLVLDIQPQLTIWVTKTSKL